jgi:TadE-like protein
MIKLRLRSSIRKSRDERGVTLLETAIVLPMLLMLAIGLAEVGFLVIDQMAVANAAREGARVGAAAGPYEDATGTIDADDLILRSVEQALCHLENGRAERVVIYAADANGGQIGPSQVNTYGLPPATPLNCTSSGSTAFVCLSCSWDPTTRDNTPPVLDDIGVEVQYRHDPILGLFPFTSILNLSDRAVMRIEPDTRG